MDGEKQGTPARPRRTQAEAAQLVAEYQASGLSRIEFCQNRGLGLSTFSRYLSRHRKGHAELARPDLIAVELRATRASAGKPQDSGLAVALGGGRRIEVARGFDAATLVRLLGTLERF